MYQKIKTLTFIPLSIIVLLACSKNETGKASPGPREILNTQQYETYGLTGDGHTDNTTALQKLIDGSSVIHLKAGIYIINKTINLKTGVKIYGESGTVIKAGSQMSGTLLNNGRYFLADRADYAMIHQVTFAQSDQAYQLSSWNNACVYILNSKSVSIENSNFNFHLPYATVGLEAVWISGTGSINNIVKNNRVNTLGIKYAENGADATDVENNVLTNAYSNALTANGNHATDYSSSCKVIGNMISNAGRMGIEDWGKTDGSLIQGNHITGTGKDPVQSKDGIGLSAVGTNVKVISNVISGAKLYAIEVRGNYGATVALNKITDNAAATAIILNYTFPLPEKASARSVAGIENNQISNSNIGVHVFGDYEANAMIRNNVFVNTVNSGIKVESGAPNYKLNIIGNKFNFTGPAVKDRFGVFTYTKFEPGTAQQSISVVADTLIYSTAAAKGPGMDMSLVIRTDKALVRDIIVQGNGNRSAGGVAIHALTAFGAKPIGVQFINNKVSGAIVDLTGYINSVLTGNNF